MSLLLSLLTAHFVSDFLLQSGFREERKGIYALWHASITGGAVFVCLLLFEKSVHVGLPLPAIGGTALLIALLHGAQDRAVLLLQARTRGKLSNLARLLGDQGLHILVLIGAAYVLSASEGAVTASTHNNAVRIDVIFGAILLLALGTGGAAVLIAYLLEPFRRQVEPVDDEASGNMAKAGLWIGLCERFLLIVVIASGSEVFSSVGLVMAAKSIFRFRELDERSKAEYYLLGSLMSACVAVIVGLGLRVLGIPVLVAGELI